MGLTDLSVKDGIDGLRGRLLDPFNKFFAPPLDMKGALERNDFKNGFNIIEIEDGKERRTEAVQLVGSSMPHVPFSFGGEQKIVKDYYPGNSEPTVQILGPRESNISIKGRLKAKTLPVSVGDANQEEIRRYPEEMQQLIEAMRIRGNLVRLYMGEFQRYGFIERTEFNMRTLADIDYTIEFSIIGFNAPRFCKVRNSTAIGPVQIKKELLKALNELQAQGLQVPGEMDKSFANQINNLIADVSEAVNLVTDTVDSVLRLNEADAIRQSIGRAKGLAKNSKNSVRRLTNRVGSFSSTGGIVFTANAGSGVSSGYVNARYMQSILSLAFSLTRFLASLFVQINAISLSEPITRHRVQGGDTLQKLAVKFYGNVDQWTEIFDHNLLQSSDLELIRGKIIEIPRIT